MPFEHVLPREIILHINWLTVGACRETENRYSKFVPERREYREYDYGSGLCVSERGGKTFIFPGTRVSLCRCTYVVRISEPTIPFRKAHFERDNRNLCVNAFLYKCPHVPHKDTDVLLISRGKQRDSDACYYQRYFMNA